MKILLLCDEQSNQIALANKIHDRFSLCGVVLESRKRRRISHASFVELVEIILDRTLFLAIRKGWTKLLKYYGNAYAKMPPVPHIRVSKINSQETVAFIRQVDPDLVMVSGTSMVRAEILSMRPTKGIINLHTGLSPYVRGGPNCTNWCLAESMFHLIGNTVMWIDEGIDSGRILASEFVPLRGDEGFLEIHIRAMEHAHDLYLRVVEYLLKCTEIPPGVLQRDVGSGKTYHNRDWGVSAKAKLMRTIITGSHKKSIKNTEQLKKDIKVVSLAS